MSVIFCSPIPPKRTDTIVIVEKSVEEARGDLFDKIKRSGADVENKHGWFTVNFKTVPVMEKFDDSNTMILFRQNDKDSSHTNITIRTFAKYGLGNYNTIVAIIAGCDV